MVGNRESSVGGNAARVSFYQKMPSIDHAISAQKDGRRSIEEMRDGPNSSALIYSGAERRNHPIRCVRRSRRARCSARNQNVTIPLLFLYLV
jgi:hypothetical protein